MSADSNSKTHPHARLCHVIKSDNFDGYGFNLHAEKGKPGQYIGKVDEGSPSETAGLRQGDRILEVNGVSIVNETHKQVVQRIKTLPNETKLLVVDPEDEQQDKHDGNNVSSTATITDSNSNSSLKSVSDTTTTASANNGQAHMEDKDMMNSNGNSNNSSLNNTSNGKHESLNLSMTAAELRAKLAAKKKFDPRKEPVDFKKKFDTVQKL